MSVLEPATLLLRRMPRLCPPAPVAPQMQAFDDPAEFLDHRSVLQPPNNPKPYTIRHEPKTLNMRCPCLTLRCVGSLQGWGLPLMHPNGAASQLEDWVLMVIPIQGSACSVEVAAHGSTLDNSGTLVFSKS